MLRRIGVNRLIRSSVHGQVRLLIAIDVKPCYANSPCNGLLENGSANNPSVPFDFAWEADVDRQKVHGAVTGSLPNPKVKSRKADQAAANPARRTAAIRTVALAVWLCIFCNCFRAPRNACRVSATASRGSSVNRAAKLYTAG